MKWNRAASHCCVFMIMLCNASFLLAVEPLTTNTLNVRTGMSTTSISEMTALLNDDNVKLQNSATPIVDKRTTETDQLQVANASELLRLLGVMPEKEKVESDERHQNLSAVAISDSAVKRILGDNPAILYRVMDEEDPLIDPMIIPWIRNAVILRETLDEANALLAEGLVSQACEIWTLLANRFPDSDEGKIAKESLAKIQQLRSAAEAKQSMDSKTTGTTSLLDRAGAEEAVELDKNIKLSLVVEDIEHPQNSYVMFGEKLYRNGDEIAGYYPKHIIKRVWEDSVEIEVTNGKKSKLFQLSVTSNTKKENDK